MHCPSCGHPNPEGARFCGSCAAALDALSACRSCGAANPFGQRFCNACGEPLEAPAAAVAVAEARYHTPARLADKIRAGRAALEGERKQITVLFADVMGSMKLAERSDPEEWRRIMERFFAILCEGVHRFGGTVDKFTGDGIMALFGAPVAHEDHGRRACYAALHLSDELTRYAGELRREHGLNFSVRIGLNSGEVVVGAIGDDLDMAYTAIGQTVGLAQRMEQLAEPGKAYLTQHTASLVKGYLALTDLGEFQVTGATRTVRVYELAGVGSARGRLDVVGARGLSRFVGRDEDLRVLESALKQSFAGRGQVVAVVGEAGVGKSRLCREFIERHRAKGVPVYHVSGQAHATSVPLVPVLQLLRAYFDIGEQDSDRTARERIAGKLVLLDKTFEDDLPLIFDFLAVPDSERPAPHMNPAARQRRLLALMTLLARAESRREPGILLFEDLHWFDPASQTFLVNHLEAVPRTRSLTVVNFRPEYRARYSSRPDQREIALAPLGLAAIDQMLADLLGSDPSLKGLSELIRRRTGGNPFFVEEVVQSLVDAGSLDGERGAYRLAAPVEEGVIPASVQAVLSARIDRLAHRDKAVLQAAAVIGQEFSEPVLTRVVELGRAELEEAVANLATGDFVYEQELYPEAVFAFKHPLTQEVAYRSQLGERRAAVHAAVARAIAELYPERLDERAALLAQHWEAAGEALEAARWHARAAGWSGYSDPNQSLWHWRQVRELTGALPESAETTALGLAARMFALNVGWRVGISHEEAHSLFEEAERMATAAGDTRSRAMLLALYGAVKGNTEGDVRGFAALARQAIALAEESQDPTLYMMVASAGSGWALFQLGEYDEGLAIADRAMELTQGDPTVAAGTTSVCPYAWCLMVKGGLLVNKGELEAAGKLIEQGRQLAREQGDLETVGWCHSWSVWHAYFVGAPESQLGHAQQALEIAERIGDSFSRSWASFFLGLAERVRGEWRQAIEALERSLTISTERRGAVEGDSMRFAVLGESYLGLGDTERARGLAEEGVRIAHERAQPSNEAYACLALARVLLGSAAPGACAETEAALARALELARGKGGKAFEPLVHVELAELARQRGDEEGRERALREAHRLFADIGATGWAERLAGELAAAAS